MNLGHRGTEILRAVTPKEPELNQASPARGDGEITIGVPLLYGNFNGVGVSPMPSASAREVSRDTASPAPTMKRPWLGAALTGVEVRVEFLLFLSGVVSGNHAFSRR